MFKEKSDKEISLQILNTYNHYFKISNAHCNKYENELKLSSQVQNLTTIIDNGNKKIAINDVLDEDNNVFFTEEVIKQINDEFISQDNEMVQEKEKEKEKEKRGTDISHLPLLIPKVIPSSYKHAFDICDLLKKYDQSNSNHLNEANMHKELEIYIMKLERNCHNKILPSIISKTIDRVTGIKVQEFFNDFEGPFIIGSYSNNYSFFNETIDLLVYYIKFTEFTKQTQILFEKIVIFVLKKLSLDSSETNNFKTNFDLQGDIIKALIKIKSTNIRLCIYFIDKENQQYKTTLMNIQSITKKNKPNIDKTILCKMLRLWRRKWNITTILPEIIDYIAGYHYSYSISDGFVKVLYTLYTMPIEGNYHPWIKTQLKEYSDCKELRNAIGFACKNTFMLLSNKDFEKIFV